MKSYLQQAIDECDKLKSQLQPHIPQVQELGRWKISIQKDIEIHDEKIRRGLPQKNELKAWTDEAVEAMRKVNQELVADLPSVDFLNSLRQDMDSSLIEAKSNVEAQL